MKSKENKFEEIFQVVRLIPFGKVTTYGQIAAFLGATSGARMIGWAMNASHGDPTIPAHRVVNKQGRLTGKMHFSTPSKMQELLEQEGHTIIEDTIKHFSNVNWDPSSDLI